MPPARCALISLLATLGMVAIILGVVLPETAPPDPGGFIEDHRWMSAFIVLLVLGLVVVWWWRGRIQRRLEEEVAQRTLLLTTLLESIPDPVFFKDADGVFLGCNPSFAALAGRSASAIIGTRDHDLVGRSQADGYRQEDQEILETRQLKNTEAWFTGAEGRRRLLVTRKAPLLAADGRVLGVLGLMHDITDLHQATERLGLVIGAVDDGIWDWDAVTDRVFFSERWKTMLGYAVDEIGDGLAEWSDRVHPDDRSGVMADIERHMQGETALYQTEHRMRCKDGSWRWILDRGRVVARDAAGKPLRVVGTHTDISARRRAEEALAESRLLAEQLIASSPLGITVYDGRSGRCLQANDAACRIIGATREQVLAQDFRAIPSWQRHRLLTDAEATLADGRPRSNEVMVVSSFGRDLWLGYHFTRFAAAGEPRLLLIYEDITLRKRMDAERAELQDDLEHRVAERTLDLVLANQELATRDRNLRIFQTVIEQNPVAIAITDVHNRMTYVNPAFQAQVGGMAQEMLGSDPLRYVDRGAGTDPLPDLDRTLHAGGIWSGEFLCRHQDGHGIWVDAIIAPLTSRDGTAIGFVNFHRDITAIKAAQAEAQQRNAELLQADKMAALGTLVAGVGHEINNPANFISLNAPLLRGFWNAALPVLDRHGAEDQDFTLNNLPWVRARTLVPRLFNGIEEGIDRIRRIVGDLRDFARPDPGGQQALAVNKVVGAAIAITTHAVGKTTQRFTSTLAPDLPPVLGSFQKLEQVLVNLLLNASQALTASDQAITLTTAWDEVRGRVTITVADEGAGMPVEVLRRIGEPFFTTKRDRGGTGLGLSVSRRIVADHGGELRFASEPGKGTTAMLLLPPRNDPATPTPATSDGPPDGTHDHG